MDGAVVAALHHPCSPVSTYPARGNVPCSVLHLPLTVLRGACKQAGPSPVSLGCVSWGAVIELLLVGCLGPWMVHVLGVQGVVDAVPIVSHAHVGDGALQDAEPAPAESRDAKIKRELNGLQCCDGDR